MFACARRASVSEPQPARPCQCTAAQSCATLLDRRVPVPDPPTAVVPTTVAIQSDKRSLCVRSACACADRSPYSAAMDVLGAVINGTLTGDDATRNQAETRLFEVCDSACVASHVSVHVSEVVPVEPCGWCPVLRR